MKITTFLPHVGVFGGVRRFLELGNAWSAMGHEVTLFHSGGDRASWLPYQGRIAPLQEASRVEADLAVCADPHTYEVFRSHRAATHLYYCVIEKDAGAVRAIADPLLRLAANSGALRRQLARRARRPVLDGIGGINLEQFHPRPESRASAPLRVLVYGRRSRPKKGTDLILRALAGLDGSLPPFEIVLFDSLGEQNRQDPRDRAPLPPNARFVINPTQDELVSLYQSAHLFVAAERKAGWCNTALEAMACGTPVVCTGSGTRDFARHLETALVTRVRHPFFLRRAIARALGDEALRDRLGRAGPAAAAPWSWPRLARRLLDQLPAA